MMNSELLLLNPSPPRRPWRDLLWNTLNVSSLAIFAFMSLVPTEALAYAQYLSTSQGPLVFERDDTLASDTLSSHDFRRRPPALRTVNVNAVAEGAIIPVVAFAYSSSLGETDSDPFTTATGERAAAGTLAANWLPFGTTVRVGEVVYTVKDRMNSRYDDKYVIDLWQSSADAAVAWGVRRVEIEIVHLP
jgi:3D (Asp-Asp-Asp) domain-containing protein